MPTLPRPAVHRLLAGVAGIVLLASACGGGGGSKQAAPPPTTPVATTAPPPGVNQLQAIVVQATDLPAGWTAMPASPPANQAAATVAFAQCMDTPNTSGDVEAVAYSPDFVDGSFSLDASASSYKSTADIQADTAALVNPKAAGCLEEVGKAALNAGLPRGYTVKTDDVSITAGAGTGPINVVATVNSTVVFGNGAHDTTLVDQTVYLIAPRIEAHVDFYSQGRTFSAAVKAAVLTKVSERVANGS